MIQSLTRLAFVSLVLFALAIFLVNLTVTRATPQRGSTAKPRGPQLGDLFGNNCARCHGADGAGDTPLGHTYNTPDFTDPEWWRKHSNITNTKSLVSIISNGQGGMPAYGKKLKPTEIRRLVDYVRKFRNQKSKAPGK
jgi:mono/diheme cytochrome c family protein